MAEYVLSRLTKVAMVPGGPPKAWKPTAIGYVSDSDICAAADPSAVGWCLVKVLTWKDRAAAANDPGVVFVGVSTNLDAALGNAKKVALLKNITDAGITGITVSGVSGTDTLRTTLGKFTAQLDAGFPID